MIRRPYVLFGLTAALLYAIQHPLSKPAANRLGASLPAIGSLLLVCEVAILLFGVAACVVHPETFAHVRKILRSRGNLGKLIFLSTIGLASLTIYLANMHMFPPVLMAVILNLFPFWNVIITAVIDRRRPRAHPVLVIGIVAALMLFTSVYFDPQFRLSGFVAQFAVISIVPIVYSIHYNMQSRYFADYKPFAFVLAAYLIDAPIVMLILIGFGFYVDLPVASPGFFQLDILLYVVGTIASSIGARTMLQKGGLSGPEGKIWTPFFTFLTPAMTAMVSFVSGYAYVHIFGRSFDPADYVPTTLSWLQVAVVSVALLSERVRQKLASN